MTKEEEERILKCTAFIQMCDKDGNAIYSGTSFFIKDNDGRLFLITNNHVIEKSNYCLLLLTLHNQKTNKVSHKQVLCDLNNHIKQHNKYDLCAIDITHEYNDLISKHNIPIISPLYTSDIIINYEDFNHIEEIYMIGYPNLKINHSNNYPMVRKGITATGLCDTIDKTNEEMFITDLPMFSCSSGSPIFYLSKEEKWMLVGVATGGYFEEKYLYEEVEIEPDDSTQPTKSTQVDTKKYTKNNNGLGLAIKANKILELISIV